MRSQKEINSDQKQTNREQNTINEQTKIDISVRNFWAIIVLVITITSIYLYSQFTTASDIKEIKTDVTYIKDNLSIHLSDYKEKTELLSRLDKQIIAIKTLLDIK